MKPVAEASNPFVKGFKPLSLSLSHSMKPYLCIVRKNYFFVYSISPIVRLEDAIFLPSPS